MRPERTKNTNCPKSPKRLRTEVSKAEETVRSSPISLLWGTEIGGPEATPDPFRTVSDFYRVSK